MGVSEVDGVGMCYRSDSFLEREALWLKVPFSKLLLYV